MKVKHIFKNYFITNITLTYLNALSTTTHFFLLTRSSQLLQEEVDYVRIAIQDLDVGCTSIVLDSVWTTTTTCFSVSLAGFVRKGHKYLGIDTRVNMRQQLLLYVPAKAAAERRNQLHLSPSAFFAKYSHHGSSSKQPFMTQSKKEIVPTFLPSFQHCSIQEKIRFWF